MPDSTTYSHKWYAEESQTDVMGQATGALASERLEASKHGQLADGRRGCKALVHSHHIISEVSKANAAVVDYRWVSEDATHNTSKT